MFNNLIGKNKELGRFLFCERYTLQPVKDAMYIAEGQELKRGAVVDVNGVLVGTSSILPYAVLEFDCDTRDGGKQASVFIKGEFNFDKLSFASGLDKSDMDNIVYNGNSVGIVIKPYEYDEGFNPIMAPAGTSEYNPLMTAEETERMIDAMKPIDDMTLRFEFSKKDYNPETAEVGSAGTWTKVDSPTLNVWDWTNDATDWSESFKGAFPDTDNDVSVIAAGDTSSVTNFKKMFAGDYTSNPANNAYVLSVRNNIVKCVPFNIKNADNFNEVFTGSCLSEFVYFEFDTNQISFAFADTFITNVGDVNFSVASTTGLFTRCSKLKRVGVLTFDDTKLATDSAFNIFNFVADSENNVLEEIGGIKGTGNVKNFTALFSNCNSLKRILSEIDMTAATNVTAVFNACHSLEKVPTLKNLGNANVTTTQNMFANCWTIEDAPIFDTSHVTNSKRMFRICKNLKEIKDYDFSSVTNVDGVFEDCFSVEIGITETYNKFVARGASITTHLDTFKNCGIDTATGAAELAQIPASWGGTGT